MRCWMHLQLLSISSITVDSDRNALSECAGRTPYCRLFTKELGDPRFQARDGFAATIVLLGNPLRAHEPFDEGKAFIEGRTYMVIWPG